MTAPTPTRLRLQKITKRWAAKHGACNESIEKLFRMFPDGLSLSDEEAVKKAWKSMDALDINWLLMRLNVLPCFMLWHNHEDGFMKCRHSLAQARDDDYSKRDLRPFAKKAGLPI